MAILKNIPPPAASIIEIITANPQQHISQQSGKELALRRYHATPNPGCKDTLISSLYQNSSIDKRHVSFLPIVPPEPELDLETRLENALDAIKPLVADAAHTAITRAGLSPSDIGQVVPVSSTVLREPGVSTHLVNTLQLRPDTERTPVSFAGCAAGVAGLRVAEDFVKSNPHRASLLVTFEVSSAHGRGVVRSVSGEVIHSLFADGCAAAVLVAADSPFEKRALTRRVPVIRIRGRRSELVSDTEDGIRLEATSAAIDCMLSKNLPKYLVKAVEGYVDRLINDCGLTREDMSYWAVHPGGRRIIESVQLACGFSNEMVGESYQVLRENGNMLSVSILFVLSLMMKRYRAEKSASVNGMEERYGAGFSFAPGVSVEGFVFSMHCD